MLCNSGRRTELRATRRRPRPQPSSSPSAQLHHPYPNFFLLHRRCPAGSSGRIRRAEGRHERVGAARKDERERADEGNGEPQRRIADGSWGACLARVWARIRGCAKTTNNHELGEERLIKKCSTLLDSIILTQGKLLYNIYSN